MHQAQGQFTITLTPMSEDGPHAMGQLVFDKIFTGDMEGTSVGQMLSHRSAVEGSAGYVAMEKLSVTLSGRSGAFYLQHSGTMQATTLSQTIAIVPDSGEGELASISGHLTIDIIEGAHHYSLFYSL